MSAVIKNRNNHGFTLIEILVAIVVLGIGLFGAAKMQLVAIQNTQGGYLRAQASNIGYDIIDRMRANTLAVTSGDYDISDDDNTPAQIDCKGADADCSTAEMAQFDQYWWRQTVDELLPNGAAGIVTVDNGTTTKVTISVTWIDPYSAADGPVQNVFLVELAR